MLSRTLGRTSNIARPLRYAVRAFNSGENTASTLKIDMKGKVRKMPVCILLTYSNLKCALVQQTVFIAGIGDDHGYGWGIAKACAEAGAKIVVGVWPVVYPGFIKNLQEGVYAESSTLSDGSKMVLSKVSFETICMVINMINMLI
jgi:hypothetical protein